MLNNFMKFTVIIYFGALFLFVLCSNKYCGPEYCGGNKLHTLCRYQSPKPPNRCVSYEKTIISEKDKHDLLHKINSRRDKVALGEIRSLPTAENMHKLPCSGIQVATDAHLLVTLTCSKVWNNELEHSAQRWADQCSGENVKDTCRDLGEAFVGQNVASIYGESPGLTPAALADIWYMELLNINKSVIKRFQPSSVTELPFYDSFTQLVWADTKQVGCGGVKFKGGPQDLYESKNKTVYRLVCNFFPGGNRIGESVYRDGAPCSRCPLGTCNSEYPGLCDSYLQQLTSTMEIEYTDLESDSSTINDFNRSVENIEMGTKKNEINQSNYDATDKDDDYNPLELFSYTQEYTRPFLSTSTKTTIPCKESFAVDDLVEMLKNKLMNDSVFKEMFATKSLGNTFSDSSVAAFADQIYSKDVPSTTVKYIENEAVNSTLLADLIEAVMLRHGVFNKEQEKGQTVSSLSLHYNSDVNPVKIQAELAEIKNNNGFTGHFFFPEDDLGNDFENESENDATESYDDQSGLPISDMILEIEGLKKHKATTNFLDKILDSDSDVESETSENDHILTEGPVFSRNSEKMTKKVKIEKRKVSLNGLHESKKPSFRNCKQDTNIIKKSNFRRKRHSSKQSKNHLIIKYNDLLQRLLIDLIALNFSHCCYNFSSKIIFNVPVFKMYLLFILCNRLLRCIG